MKPESVIRACCNDANITVKEFLSNSRRMDIVRVRKRVSFILYEYHKLSMTAIGRLLGGKDRTTIAHHLATANGAKMQKKYLPDSPIEDELVEAYNESLQVIRKALKKNPLESLLKIAEALQER